LRRIVTGDYVAEWVARRVGRSIELPATTLGVEIDGRLAGGVVFSGWNGFDIEITVAGDREAWTPVFFRRFRAYVFDELSAIRITARTEQESVAELALRLGGRIEGLMRCYYGPGRDAYVIGVLKDDWRF